jgi:hypothetical protein
MNGRIYLEEEKEQFLKDFIDSGRSIRSFCKENKLGTATLHRWLTQKNAFREAGFSALEIRMPQAEEGLFASIELGGSIIRIYQPVPGSYLKELAV